MASPAAERQRTYQARREREHTMPPATPARDNVVFVEGMTFGTLANGHYQNQKPLWLMLPESAAREILSFNDKLNIAERADDGSLTIEFNRVFPDRRIRKAVAFLLSDSLAAITGFAIEISTTLNRLVEPYNFSLDLSIPKLENAIIDHINNSRAFTTQPFIDLAASYLDSRQDARTTNLGRFFESHLKENLQSAAEIEGASYSLKLKTGGLGKVYIDLLEEDRKEHWKQVAKRSAAARACAIKIEDDDVKLEVEDDDYE